MKAVNTKWLNMKITPVYNSNEWMVIKRGISSILITLWGKKKINTAAQKRVVQKRKFKLHRINLIKTSRRRKLPFATQHSKTMTRKNLRWSALNTSRINSIYPKAMTMQKQTSQTPEKPNSAIICVWSSIENIKKNHSGIKNTSSCFFFLIRNMTWIHKLQ